MKKIVLLMMLVLALAAACSSDKSKELFETAQFEEKQNNKEHAKKLYQEIVDKYPDSPLAKQAQERVAALAK
uniref:Lipoprotein n=1 Tax=Geobacter sp. (strain M21) TaxID=443144 RepID=C6E0P9_GEOSM